MRALQSSLLIGRQMVEQPAAMIHLRTVRDYAKVDHGSFFLLVFWTNVHISFHPKLSDDQGNPGYSTFEMFLPSAALLLGEGADVGCMIATAPHRSTAPPL